MHDKSDVVQKTKQHFNSLDQRCVHKVTRHGITVEEGWACAGLHSVFAFFRPLRGAAAVTGAAKGEQRPLTAASSKQQTTSALQPMAA